MRDLDHVESADILLVDASKNVANWGTGAEAFFAWILDKPVVAWGVQDDPPLWLGVYVQHGVACFTLSEALEYICEEYGEVKK